MTAQLASGSVAKRIERSLEWPTLALCGGLYAAFAALTYWHAALPTLLVAVGGALLVALHGSMQHEIIHGHPTPWRLFNRALGFPSLALWLPFEAYRISHIVHHRDEALTDPLDDPESYYWSAEQWHAIGPAGRLVVRLHTTLAGRLLIGPAWNIARFLQAEGRAVARGDRLRRRIWAWHLVGVAAMLLWIVGVCGINPLFYVFAIVYPGTSILLLRSFAEHRAQDGVFERTAIVENSWVFGPLFLFNNLHAAHHERPLIPWYRLPAWYAANRARLLATNGGLVYDGYGEVARRFLFTPHDVNLHPAQADPVRATGLASDG